jgi:hypothetical protein
MIFSIPEHKKDLWKSAAYFHTKRKMKKRKCKYGASIELHAPTSSTQKLKLMMKGGNSLILQHSPSRAGSPRPYTWILKWAVIILINTPARTHTRDLWP